MFDDQESRRSEPGWTLATKALSVLVGLASVVAGAWGVLSSGLESRQGEEDRAQALSQEASELRADLDDLSAQFEALEGDGPGAGNPTATDQRLSALTTEVNDVDARLAGIEDAISDDPARMLEIPMLAEDVDDLATQTQQDIDAVRSDVDRVYDITKTTIFGLLAALLLLAVPSLIDRLKGRTEPPPENEPGTPLKTRVGSGSTHEFHRYR